MFAPPLFITEGPEPYRARVALWLELPSGLIVGQQLTEPTKADGLLGRALVAALERPLVGAARRPSRIRVTDAALVPEIRAVIGDNVPIRTALAPELDALLDAMIEAMEPQSDEEPSYLDDGRIPEEVMADLFQAAEMLYCIAPWRLATDDQVVRIDIRELAVDGWCLSVIGALEENRGIVLFPSLEHYEAFAPEEAEPIPGDTDLGSGYLALTFERGAELPDRMRREIAAHGWPVAGPEAYPFVGRIDRDAAPRPLAERDLRITAACARALASFCARNPRIFDEEEPVPACESISDDVGPTVHVTAPYEAFPLFEIEDEPPTRATRARRPGRNDPCHCGSGRKYKKCHLREDEHAHAQQSRPAALHALDRELVADISAFASSRFGAEARGWVRDFDDPDEALALAMPWSVYHACIQGRPAFEWFLEEARPRPNADERRWLDAQRSSWLSIWEVTEVRPGEGLTLRDLLSDEERSVHEILAAETLVRRDCVLARVVESDSICVLGGMYPRALPPVEGAEVVRRARGRLRRKRAVPVDRLRGEKIGLYLIRRWEEALAELELRWSQPPDLRNTDGDPLLLTTDHFEIAPGRGADVEARLSVLDGVLPPEPGDADPTFDFRRTPAGGAPHTPGATLLGSLRLSGERIRVETNSTARADDLRARIEERCGDLVRHRTRQHTDPMSEPVRESLADRPRETTPPEAQQLVLDYKRSHYAGWLDEPLPALDGKSPREAARSKGGRAALDVLLKDMEHTEQRSPPGERFDFSEFRLELRLDD